MLFRPGTIGDCVDANPICFLHLHFCWRWGSSSSLRCFLAVMRRVCFGWLGWRGDGNDAPFSYDDIIPLHSLTFAACTLYACMHVHKFLAWIMAPVVFSIYAE
jgi:hypothetical protein